MNKKSLITTVSSLQSEQVILCTKIVLTLLPFFMFVSLNVLMAQPKPLDPEDPKNPICDELENGDPRDAELVTNCVSILNFTETVDKEISDWKYGRFHKTVLSTISIGNLTGDGTAALVVHGEKSQDEPQYLCVKEFPASPNDGYPCSEEDIQSFRELLCAHYDACPPFTLTKLALHLYHCRELTYQRYRGHTFVQIGQPPPEKPPTKMLGQSIVHLHPDALRQSFDC